MPGTAPTGWQEPKTDWDANTGITHSELNKIGANAHATELGSRTIDPTQAPSSNVGTLRQLLDWLANRVKAITGKTNWYDAPATTLEAAKTHIDAAAPHSGHATTTDLSAHTSAAAPHSGHETPAGAQAKVDTHANLTAVHSATSAATADRIILRDSAGRAKVAAPSATDDIAQKAQADAVQTNLDSKMNATTGHKHTGAAGDGPLIPLASITPAPASSASFGVNGVCATGLITFTGNPVPGNTVTIGSKTYIFNDAVGAPYYVKIQASKELTAKALREAINNESSYQIDPASGTDYWASTPVNPEVWATLSGAILTVQARSPGLAGNYAMSKVCAGISLSGEAMTGGVEETGHRHQGSGADAPLLFGLPAGYMVKVGTGQCGVASTTGGKVNTFSGKPFSAAPFIIISSTKNSDFQPCGVGRRLCGGFHAVAAATADINWIAVGPE